MCTLLARLRRVMGLMALVSRDYANILHRRRHVDSSLMTDEPSRPDSVCFRFSPCHATWCPPSGPGPAGTLANIARDLVEKG